MSEKYEFIDAECAALPGEGMRSRPSCRCANGWEYQNPDTTIGGRGRKAATAQRRELLEIKIKALFEANNEEYGYRRMHAALVRGGERCETSSSARSCASWAWSPASRSRGATR